MTFSSKQLYFSRLFLHFTLYFCKMNAKAEKITVSVIIPIHNGGKWISDCFKSIFRQDALNNGILIEISVCDDASSDDTLKCLLEFKEKIQTISNLTLKIYQSLTDLPKGVGCSKNRAVKNSCGAYLCFQDIDDVMEPNRISQQLYVASTNRNAIVGSKFCRDPEGSTPRFQRWANNLPQDLLSMQVYTSHGPTIIMPTWFCSREVYDRVGGFSEDGAGTPEDLLFFYKHLDLGGDVMRVDQMLLTYRFHPQATTFSIAEETIWSIRIKRLEKLVLPKWQKFTIWNAGKQGRKFWRSLSKENQLKVENFCDVDVKKVGTVYQPYSLDLESNINPIPILHFQQAKPPLIICVKLDMTGGNFEKNLQSLNLKEGVDYILFS